MAKRQMKDVTCRVEILEGNTTYLRRGHEAYIPGPGETFEMGGRNYQVISRRMPLHPEWWKYNARPPTIVVEGIR